MTIAACFVTPEGIVLGADSTASIMLTPGSFRYFNYNQKVFEIGDPGTGTLGVVTWGLGGLGELSYRTLLALLADDLKKKPAKTVTEAASRWIDQFWTAYEPATKPCRDLNAKGAHDPSAPANPAMRTKDQEEQLKQLTDNLGVGFCMGGYTEPSRTPEAYTMAFQPLQGKPTPVRLAMTWSFWGAPNMIQRLIFGRDANLRDGLLASGKWSGTPADLDTFLSQYQLVDQI